MLVFNPTNDEFAVEFWAWLSNLVFVCVFRYLSKTVNGVQVMEGKATELNFTLSPVVEETEGSTTLATTTKPSTARPTTTVSSNLNTTHTQVVSTKGNKNTPPVHQPIQPKEFRHHNYADMELFLRKYNSEFSSITYLHSIGRSVKDRELYVMIISDNPNTHEHGTSFCSFSINKQNIDSKHHFSCLNYLFFLGQVNPSLSMWPTCMEMKWWVESCCSTSLSICAVTMVPTQRSPGWSTTLAFTSCPPWILMAMRNPLKVGPKI